MTQKKIVPTQLKPDLPRLMLFELSSGGHYPEYLAHLIRYWCKADLKGSLLLVVSPEFCQKHPEVVELEQNNVSLIPITIAEEKKLVVANSTYRRIIRAFQEFKLASQYALNLKASEILFTYFDTRQLPLFLGQKLPCPFSGIYFRPRFHYAQLVKEKVNWQEKFSIWQEKLLLAATLKKPQLKCIFSLDPFAIKYFPSFSRGIKAIAIPDPVEIHSDLTINPEALKNSLGIESQRRVLLLFGGLTKRKGIIPLLEACSYLSPQIAQKITLLLVGPISSDFQAQIQAQIADVTQSLPIQIISDYRYVSLESEKQAYFQISDVILALYQRHVGMSAIIIRAAASQKPVLSSDYGLMGEITRRYNLGLTVDSTNSQEIAQNLKKLVTKLPTELFDCDRAQKFAHQNSPENFAQTIFNGLGIIP